MHWQVFECKKKNHSFIVLKEYVTLILRKAIVINEDK